MTAHTLEVAERVADAPGQKHRQFGKRIPGPGGRTRRVIKPDTFLWLASHELRLAWRDWMALMTLGRRRQMRNAAIALIIFGAFMHLLSYSMIRRYAGTSIEADKPTLIVVTGI